ncbi:RrF2 family transcriptional regulator [Rhodospirillum rubrum]|uniref:Transcriptional regulator, BadM/Rrf2 family n=1 Tax=Rhodospirillum rubrum (strain ATCC 11170 / ATH 1.1.1 / DSM 467 / LMG 4362 / NCIMB 8255 / S1) TaxID=269796 RepID=Q2RMQ6_RHORT|nr:Rrf2 family transcriptional regulator [Rhodospirillum rubrum]ABC24589.1 transcriptional regulator, BadM/Rrf2 family [Rhodospirillum rubrum ATCC 11170]AEO50342.1 BadM/Rrf2 family transcriptional regulator [Rhodospirillum rubrum F11]MBK5956321.1 transcriptional regulator [Rhodospirillum rubrum]QXG80503.1 Rrf2 family transcriptional regulator [Rhodospirillum rubrum]HCF17745.1 Rrf2 family transcriptional regulator [Rhodospirillum rubrum]
MIRLSKKMLFAIEAVLDIAYHAGGEPVQSREITRRQGIPRRYLEQTLQHLVRSGVLTGVRGPRGGYRLARERRRITIGEIVRVVRDLEAIDEAVDELPGSDLGRQVVRPLWNELHDELMVKLDTLTVDDLCTRAYRDGIPSEAEKNLDFTI